MRIRLALGYRHSPFVRESIVDIADDDDVHTDFTVVSSSVSSSGSTVHLHVPSSTNNDTISLTYTNAD